VVCVRLSHSFGWGRVAKGRGVRTTASLRMRCVALTARLGGAPAAAPAVLRARRRSRPRSSAPRPSPAAAFHASAPHRARAESKNAPSSLATTRSLGLVVAVRVSGADKSRGARAVAVHHRDGGQATEAFEQRRPDDHLAAEPEMLAERVRRGVGLTGQHRREAKIAAVDHPFEPTVQRSRDRRGAGGKVRCVTLIAKAERDVGAELSRFASRWTLPTSASSAAAVPTRSRSSVMLDAATASRGTRP
jgi:hypothetical protein